MLIEGIKLMFVGMGTVILFLCFMILLLQLISKITKGHTARELQSIELERKLLAEAAKARKKKEQDAVRSMRASHDDEDDIAVIAAAIAAFEAERLSSC